jgi:hypothetical protein
MAALVAAAGTALAAPRQYRGSETLKLFTELLIQQCGALDGGSRYPGLAAGELVYLGGSSNLGATQMGAGQQELVPITRQLRADATEACKPSIPAGPFGEEAINYTPPGTGATAVGSDVQQWVVNLDGIGVATRSQNAARCEADTADDPSYPGVASLAFGPSKAFPVRANGATSGPVLFTYSFQNWRDVLRVLYTGADSTLTAAQGGGSNQLASNRIARCNSDVRRSLVNDWDNIIHGSADCGTVAFSCQNTPNIGTGGLRHVLRRDDLAATTDTFLSLLGLNSTGGSLQNGNLGINEPFCNGRDHQDLDPIRIVCTTKVATPVSATNANGGPSAPNAALNDEICSASSVIGSNVVTVSHTQSGANPLYTIISPDVAGTGLVQAIAVPTLISTTGGIPSTNNPTGTAGNRRPPTLDELYPTQNCLQGVFEFRAPPRQNVFVAASNGTALQPNASVCPDGAALLGGLCLTPVFKAGNAEQGNAHCINANNNRTSGAVDPVPGGANQSSGSLWNAFIRAAPGSGFTSAANQSPVLRSERGRDAMYSTFRLRERVATQAAGVTPEFPYTVATQSCREIDATQTMGCLSATAECTIGYDGREVVNPSLINNVVPLLVGNDTNADPNVIGASTVGLGPSIGGIRAISDGSPIAQQYQFARRMYVSSFVGFDQLSPGQARFSDLDLDGHSEQLEFAQCLTREPAIVLSATTTAGFVSRVAGSGAVLCQEFNESLCGATPLPDNDPSLIASCQNPLP